MTVFPSFSTIRFKAPFSEEIEFRTLIGRYGSESSEQRKQQWLFPKRNLSIGYENITIANARTLWQFYLSRKGSYEAFNLFYSRYDTYTTEYIGTGDGSTTVFNLPCKNSSSRTVYINYDSQVEDTDYTFSALGGIDGADQITFSVAPSAGGYITISFIGQLKVRCRFAEDRLSFDTFYEQLITMSLKLKGLLNE